MSINNALYWKIIEYGVEHGCESFDMGRSPADSGSFKYKLSWGGDPVQLYYSYFMPQGHQPPRVDTLMMRWMVRGWRQIPLGVANALGPRLIKNVL